MPETRRRVVNVLRDPFLPYDMEGPLQEDITWLPVSWDDAAGQGSYLMRMEPGARTLAHEHPGVRGVPDRGGDADRQRRHRVPGRRLRQLPGRGSPLVDRHGVRDRRLRVAACRRRGVAVSHDGRARRFPSRSHEEARMPTFAVRPLPAPLPSSPSLAAEARTIVVDEPDSYPCRRCLRDAAAG